MFAAYCRTTQVNGNPFGVVVGDYDRDGRPDLATANYGNGTVSVMFPTRSCRLVVAMNRYRPGCNGPAPI